MIPSGRVNEMMRHWQWLGHAGFSVALASAAFGQIPKPDDAPKPLPAEESAQRFQLPPGYKLELVACEPLVREPSGFCWDERGEFFVCELHGYNLEGQYDIEALNQTGQLDRVVRRVQADEQHKQAAEAETYGTIKRLHDSDGDGRMDRADVWADRIPPCLGICPARGGLIAACQTQVLFLADRDGDGRAEVREVLFEGFAKGPLERSINCPQWGPDGWVYLGCGAGGGTIRGKYLKQPVELPRTDFRIRPDGSAIEPVVGSTATMGFAFTESGDRFVISTRTPGIFVAPLPWRYLERNPDVPAPSLQEAATSDQRTWPSSQPHPWRTRRAEDPGFAKYYSDRYGIEESAPSGYFTSACSPLVYRDAALPGLRGQLLACEPAQNLVHRAIVQREGARLKLHRAPGEENAEFLTSSDPWFHAIALSHAPDGSVYIADFYREIIEDYSAIPRYLQQQYGLTGGQDHGRIWRLTHMDLAGSPDADMSQLNASQLAEEVASARYWRRQTAKRLLVEQQQQTVAPILSRHVLQSSETEAVLNALHTLDELDAMDPSDVRIALGHADPAVRRLALRLAERWLDGPSNMIDDVLRLVSDEQPMVRLQLALSLGESHQDRALQALASLARNNGDDPWMTSAILSSLSGRGQAFLSELLRRPKELGHADSLLEPLCAAIANRRNGKELSQTLVLLGQQEDHRLQVNGLRGIRVSLRQPVTLELSESASTSVKTLTRSAEAAVRAEALSLITLLKLESAAERQARLNQAAVDLVDVQLSSDARLAALQQLVDDQDPKSTKVLLSSLQANTPRIQTAILDAILAREDRLPTLLDEIEAGKVPASVLNAIQRTTLLESSKAEIRERSASLLNAKSSVEDEIIEQYANALQAHRDIARGEQLFRDKCASCHHAHSIGHTVGPDLSAEFLRAEETIILDVLAPSDKISPGYLTYTAVTTSGQVVSGLLADESPTSITLRQAEGKEQVVLRKDIEQLRTVSVSMMPDDLVKTVSPRDLADVMAWLRRAPRSRVLVDENRDLVNALSEGSGTAAFINEDAYAGSVCLRVTPPQRYAPRLPDWTFRIRQNPGPGEYRYLRFAWKAPQADGIMLELADSGRWPPAREAIRRYHAGRNTTDWSSVEVAASAPRQWTVVTRDLWKEFGDFTLTGIAPTAMGGAVLFDRIELLQVDVEQ